MRDFLIVLSGANREVLQEVRTERTKFVGIGGAVLTTSVLATISMWFALSSALGVNPFLALPLALLWGLAIMGLDRWLVTTIPAEGRRRFRLALPRVAIALLLGFVISTPLVLQIFRSEIDAQITVIHQRETDEFIKSQKTGAGGQDVAYWRAQVDKYQRVIASKGDEPTDPATDQKVISLTKQRDQAQQTADRHYKEWQCQLYGGDGCTVQGDGPLAAASERAYRKAAQLVTDLNQQIETRKQQLTAKDEQSKNTRLQEAQEALPKAKEQLDTALRRQNDLQAKFDQETKTSDGLLLRLQALNEITDDDTTLATTRVLLFLLFLLFECLPVVVKLMQSAGTYEKLLDLKSRKQFREARQKYAGDARPEDAGRATGRRDGPDRSIRDIWVREQPTSRPAAPAASPSPAASSGEDDAASRARREDERWSEPTGIPPTSLDHVALQEMEDIRFDRSAGRAETPSGGIDLFGDDEY